VVGIRKQLTAREEVQHIFDKEIGKLSDLLKMVRANVAK